MKTKLLTQPHYFISQPLDNTGLAYLCGPLYENLRQISAALDVSIFCRGDKFIAAGSNAEHAVQILDQFYAIANKVMSVDEIQLGLVEQRAKLGVGKKPNAAKTNGSEPGDASTSDPADADLTETDIESPILKTRRSHLRGRTPHQSQYIRSILEHDVTLGIGPAETGKTYLTMACAVDALERDAVKRIVLTRPAVEAGERLGFLPGDLAQNVDPYLRPLYEALYDLLGFDHTQKMFEKQAIEIAPLAYMRGLTLNHAFIIRDEA